MTTKNKNNSQYRPNAWFFLTTTVSTAIAKGQLLLFGILLIISIMAFRVPAEQIPALMLEFKDLLLKNQFAGWGFFSASTLISGIVIKSLRSAHAKEIKRISDEKTILHEMLGQRKMVSSQKPRGHN